MRGEHSVGGSSASARVRSRTASAHPGKIRRRRETRARVLRPGPANRARKDGQRGRAERKRIEPNRHPYADNAPCVCLSLPRRRPRRSRRARTRASRARDTLRPEPSADSRTSGRRRRRFRRPPPPTPFARPRSSPAVPPLPRPPGRGAQRGRCLCPPVPFGAPAPPPLPPCVPPGRRLPRRPDTRHERTAWVRRTSVAYLRS